MAEPQPGGVRFEEAIAALRTRLSIAPAEWDAILREVEVDAEAAARSQVQAMLRDLETAVLEAMEGGGTADTFAEDYRAIIDRYGWSEGSDWHRRLIYRQTVQTSYAAGRWEQAQRMQKATPQMPRYFRYITAGDNRVRPRHREWQGIILPVDHKFWKTHFPPNGFNCRCHAQIVTKRDLERYGWTVTRDSDPRLQVAPDRGFANNPGIATARIRKREEIKRRAGEGGGAYFADIDDDTFAVAQDIGLFGNAEEAREVARALVAGFPEAELRTMALSWELDDWGDGVEFSARSDGASIVRKFSSGGEVEHAYFVVAPEYQGGGHAKAMLRSSLALYQRIGISRIRLHANIDVGGYAWAKMGFLPDDPDDLRDVIARRLQRLEEGPVELGGGANYLAVARADLEEPDFAYRIAHGPLGKKLLLHTDWYGTLDLDDPEAVKRLKDAIGG